ncbi:MAG: hypothetical protein Q8L08_10905, partial [Candidatus Nanopelagicaceae bacterium]|nr:hypothetical protein [Candidatus Nanopelagicaceae bacterium]
ISMGTIIGPLGLLNRQDNRCLFDGQFTLDQSTPIITPEQFTKPKSVTKWVNVHRSCDIFSGEVEIADKNILLPPPVPPRGPKWCHTQYFKDKNLVSSVHQCTEKRICPWIQSLSVEVIANPSKGTAPLNGVSLTATVAGSAQGTINYTFYCDRPDSDTNITSGWGAKFDGVSDNPKTATCNYPDPGTYTAKVIVERGAFQAEARATITVDPPYLFAEKVVRVFRDVWLYNNKDNIPPLGTIIGCGSDCSPTVWKSSGDNNSDLRRGDLAKYLSEYNRIANPFENLPQSTRAIYVELSNGKKGWIIAEWTYKGNSMVLAEAALSANLAKSLSPEPFFSDIKGKWNGSWIQGEATGRFEINIEISEKSLWFHAQGSETTPSGTEFFTIGGSLFGNKIFFYKYYPDRTFYYEGDISGDAASGTWQENSWFGSSGTWSMTRGK